MTSREQFETQIRLHTDESEIEERLKKANGGLNYTHPETDIAWIWWRASREAVEVELPSLKQTDSGERYVWSDGVFNFKEDAIKAIRAAGIKVIEGEKKNG
ncbi:hypothetical protein [Hafnia paralvei]|uniref:hypothetical protein n=1 Tax=Hafnia paralvei TaxID=546367 RepID=UPI003C5E1A0C